jgi:predicted nucleic acid-binding protein
MKAVLDTSVVIATDVGPLEGELSVSAVTLAELHYGVLVAKDDAVRAERLRRLTILQRSFDPLPVDDVVSASYGQLAAALVKMGRSPRPRIMDLLIAATAHANGALLYTLNAGDLVGLDGLVEVVQI